MRKSPSSFFHSSHLSCSISFENDYDVEGSDNSSLTSSMNVATTTGAMTTVTSTVTRTGTAHASEVGGSLSLKRSSLDLRNELLSGIIRDNDDNSVDNEDRNSDDSTSFGNVDSMVDNSMQKRGNKGGRNALSLLSNTFTRKLFSRSKQHEHQRTSSWRIFGSKKWKNIGGNHAIFTTGASCSSATDDICCSTTAQYLALIEATKRQEAKRARQRQQLLEMKRKEEDKAAAAAEVWCSRILPNWENMKDSKHCRELWWRGIPPKVRGHVWSLAIGNELNLTPGYISDVALICYF
ncbi:unnamed protein product [Brugia timori]|uniref:Rab-GAP TBC domain-containing protein n=1 Tax=Brugia timori TaxID=42155 RepID=A0A0R3QX80_9BILA|nr:unnamed protein product [Brugia timori]